LADLEWKVSTEQFISTADQLAIEKKKMKQLLDSWNFKVRKLCDQWQSQGSEETLQGAKQLAKNSETMLIILEEYIRKLHALSGVYTQSEQQVKQKIQSLPIGDVFQ